MPASSPPAPLPLAGIRVVELGTSVAVPYGAWILATLGADVVKVERPGTGDDCRVWGPPFPSGLGAFFPPLNANKKSVVVDYGDPDQLARLRRLILEETDIVLQNLRPGRAEKYGLGADQLLAENDRLIYCNLGAFGRVGPLKDHPGYDPLMQAFGGLMSVNGEEGRAPARVGTSIVDMGSGMWCVIGALAALHRRDETGKGGRIDASLYETALGWMNYHTSGYYASGKDPQRIGSKAPGMAPYQAYECADGYLVIAGPNDRLFAKIAAVLGHPEWAQDPRFDSNQKRYANLDRLNALMEPILKRHPREYWREKLDAVGVPSAPTQAVSEMLAHPQTEALGIVEDVEGGKWRLMGFPISFDGHRPPQRTGSPDLGQHTKDVFKE